MLQPFLTIIAVLTIIIALAVIIGSLIEAKDYFSPRHPWQGKWEDDK